MTHALRGSTPASWTSPNRAFHRALPVGAQVFSTRSALMLAHESPEGSSVGVEAVDVGN